MILTALIAAVLLVDPPKEISGHCGVEANGKMYIVGGMGFSNTGSFFPTLWQIDPGHAQWHALPNITTPRAMAGCAYLDGSIYVAGGFNWSGVHTKSVERFDFKTTRWTEVAPLKHPRSRFCLVAANGKLYAISGMRGDSDGTGTLNTTIVEAYDPSKNSWRDAGNIRRPRHGFGAISWHGRIYVFGGYADDQTNSCEVWDPKTGKSTDLPPMPEPRGFHGAVLIGDKMVCFGGRPAPAHPSIFDPTNLKWSHVAGSDIDLDRFVAGVMGGKVWTVGGETHGPKPPVLQSFDLGPWVSG